MSESARKVKRLEVAIRHRVGALALDVAFDLTEPWTVLFGPSGGGKSTVLRVIAGLMRPQAGRIVSRVFPGTELEREMMVCDLTCRVFVPPHLRVIRYVGQQAALFPHRNVLENVTYGARFAGRKHGDVRQQADDVREILALCRVEHLAGKMPGEISGGERQRVALARALGAGPGRAMLLDEPFTGLDAGLRDEIVKDLKVWLGASGTPVLQVTHDVGEVFALRAEVIRMRDGRVVAQGAVDDVLREERERLVGQLNVASLA